MVSSAFDPLRIPDELWVRDDIANALITATSVPCSGF